MKAIEVYTGSDGDLTQRYYLQLEKRGAIGLVALNLFRAQKSSARAKVYRGGNANGRYKDQAYQKKQWSLDLLVDMLRVHALALDIRFGWKEDPGQEWNPWVLYVDLPEAGQVSFHSPHRGKGPDYAGDWDREHKSEERIILFCDRVFALQAID